jgi:hypothetical protein
MHAKNTQSSIFDGYISSLFLDSKDEHLSDSCFYLPIYMTPADPGPTEYYSKFEIFRKSTMQGLVLQRTGSKQGEYRRIRRFIRREGAIGAYEAASGDDARGSDYDNFMGEDNVGNSQYTITTI